MQNKNIYLCFFLAIASIMALQVVEPILGHGDTINQYCNIQHHELKRYITKIQMPITDDVTSDPYEVEENETLQITITTGWSPPQPNTLICLWIDVSTLPTGATLTPDCHCEQGEVSSIFEWTPSSGQSGEYEIIFQAGESCYESIGSFSITIIVYPSTEKPPIVDILSPINGSVVNYSEIAITGLITDDTGIISLGAHHEWIGGETITSGTIHPPETYYPFEWSFTLVEGWNRITIFTEDGSGLYAEDSIVIFLSFEYSIQFNQLDYYLDEVETLNSDWGMMHLTFSGFSGIRYLNLVVNTLWAIQNLPIQSIEGPGEKQTQCFGFPLGITSGYDIHEIAYGYSLTNDVISIPPPMTNTALVGEEDYRIYNGGTDVVMHTHPTTAQPVIGVNTTPIEHKHADFPNQEAENYTCAPTAVSNSLKFLKRKHNLSYSNASITIEKMKEACNWGEKTDNNGTVIGTGCWITHNDSRLAGERNAWWEDKKAYMTSHNISITTRKLPPTRIGDIASEIDNGQDIEAELGGHTVSIVGIKDLGNGNYSVTIAHDKNQSRPGGCITETGVWNSNTSSWSGALAGYKLNYFVVECPLNQNNPPDAPHQAEGSTTGTSGMSYLYRSSSTDPEQDDILYQFNWGDGTSSGWLGPLPSGHHVESMHIWTQAGSYQVKIVAKDIWGATSSYSLPLIVTIHGVLGDMNGDSRLNAADIRYLAMYLNGDPAYSPLYADGDVNSDVRVNAADVRYLAMYINGDPFYSPLYP